MKCPNCSFSNPDAADFCKVCGFEIPKETKATLPKAPPIEDEEEMDSALSALFGASVEDEPEVYHIELKERKEPPMSSHSKPTRALALVGALGVIVVFLLIVAWPKLPFSKKAPEDLPSTETPTPPIVETPQEEEVNENAIAIDTIKRFFIEFPNLLNDNSIAVLSLFERPDLALETLTQMSGLGSIQSVTHLIPVEQPASEEGLQAFEVFATFYHESDGESKTTEILWTFELVEIDGTTYIRGFETDQDFALLTPPAPTPAPSPAPTPTPTPEPPVQAPKIPVGFLITGGFSGGQGTERYDLSSARYGNNVDFERLVFDFNLSNTATASEAIGTYSARISDDGKSITLVLEGVDVISADGKAIDFKGAKTVKSVSYGNVPAASITITLTGPGAYRVFELKSPGRLVVDFLLTQ